MICKKGSSKVKHFIPLIIGFLLVVGIGPVMGQQGGPVALIAGEPLEVGVNDDLTLDGSFSSGSDECPLVDYFWELDGDYDYDDAFGPIVNYSWDSNGLYEIILLVWDNCDDYGVYQATVNVTDNSVGGLGGPVIEVCGDGVVQTGEECDDGNLINGDGCDSSCNEEPEDSNEIPEFPAAIMPTLIVIGGYLSLRLKRQY